MNSINNKKKVSFRYILLGSLIVTSLSTGTEASWSSPRCAVQCSKQFFASKNMVGLGILRNKNEKVINDYKKLLNDCAVNCKMLQILDVAIPGYQELDPVYQDSLKTALKHQYSAKKVEQMNTQVQLEAATQKGSKSKIKDLTKKNEKLIAEMEELAANLKTIQGTSTETPEETSKEIPPRPTREAPVKPSEEEPELPKEEPKADGESVERPVRPPLKLEEDVLKKIAHPEGQKFIEPKIPEIDGFVEDKATLASDEITLTKWGILKILQATGVIVKTDKNEKRMIEVPNIKDRSKMTKIIKPIDKNDVDKVITNDPKPKQAGTYSESVYFITVDPRYLANGHTQTHYVLKKNKWAFETVLSRHENTPAKELIDLQKVQAYIVPKLSKAKYAKIATIGNSAFYVDENGEKQYFVVLDTANGRPLFDYFTDLGEKDSKTWHDILFKIGVAVGELHALLADPEANKINIKDLNDIKTIPHGDMHMNNIFYDEKTNSVTFIDTGSMADALREKGSPITDLIQIFGTTKYYHRITEYDFSRFNADFMYFADGYSKGFSNDKKTQEKIKNLVVDYVKMLSNEYGRSLSLRMMNDPRYNKPTIPLINLYIDTFVNMLGGVHIDFVLKTFHDSYVSKPVKTALLPTLLHHKAITQQEANAEMTKSK